MNKEIYEIVDSNKKMKEKTQIKNKIKNWFSFIKSIFDNLQEYKDKDKHSRFITYQHVNEIKEIESFINYTKYCAVLTVSLYIPLQMIIENSKKLKRSNLIFSFLCSLVYITWAIFLPKIIEYLIRKTEKVEKIILIYRIILYLYFTSGIIFTEIVNFRTNIYTVLYPNTGSMLFWIGQFILINHIPLLLFVRNPKFQFFVFFQHYMYFSFKFGVEIFTNIGETIKTFVFVVTILLIFINLFSFRQKIFKIDFENYEYLIKKNKEWKNIFKSLPQTVLIISEDLKLEYSSNKLQNLNESFDINLTTYEEFKEMLDNNKIFNENNIETNNFDLENFIFNKKQYNDFSIFNKESGLTQDSNNKNNFKFFIHMNKNSDIILEVQVLQIDYEMKISYLFLIEDISNRNKLLVLQKNEEFKNRLISSFSHELKTPINGVSIPLQNCIEDPNVNNNIKKKYLYQIRNSLLFLECVTNDMIDYGAISSKQFKLFNSEINIKELGLEIAEIIKNITQVKNLNFQLEICDNVNCIENDRSRIKQITMNLLRNAVKFTNKGKVVLKISKEYIQNLIHDDYPRIKIEVIDTGIGMNNEQQDELVRLLFSHNLSYVSGINLLGSGLGLIISQNIAKHTGPPEIGIKFTSEYKKGSKFYFYLDDKINEIKNENYSENSFALIENERNEETNRMNKYDLITFSKPLESKIKIENCQCPRILLVDDESFNIMALEMILKPFNYNYAKAFNGIESVKIIENFYKKEKCEFCEGFGLILMDIQMPGMNGIEATKKIKEIELLHKGKDIPIVACTAFNSKQDFDNCMNVGMIDFINKPISKAKIEEIIKKYLN